MRQEFDVPMDIPKGPSEWAVFRRVCKDLLEGDIKARAHATRKLGLGFVWYTKAKHSPRRISTVWTRTIRLITSLIDPRALRESTFDELYILESHILRAGASDPHVLLTVETN